MHTPFTLALFTPSEAEKITGLSTVMQRDWRHRGFLPKNEGHARFDGFDLALMWSMKMLADRGIGPQLSSEVANWCAAGIMWQALKSTDCYEGEHLRTFEWLPPEGRPRRPEVDLQAIEAIKSEAERRGFDLSEWREDPNGISWTAQSEWIARQIFFGMKSLPRVIPAPYFIWWADGTHVFCKSVNEAFSDGSWEPKYSGPVVILDLYALATALLEKAGRAFVYVEYQTDPENGAILSPFEFGQPVPLAQNPEIAG